MVTIHNIYKELEEINDENNDNNENNENNDNNDNINEIINIPIIKDLSADELRKGYSKFITVGREQFDTETMIRLWDSWMEKGWHFPSTFNSKLILLRKFIIDPDQKELILNDKPPDQRASYHQICKVLKLEHCSIENNYDDDGVNPRINDNWRVLKDDCLNGVNPNPRINDNWRELKDDCLNPVKNIYDKYHSKYRRSQDKMFRIANKTKTMIIRKPQNWNWEYTIVSDNQLELDGIKMKEIIKKHREWVQFMKTKKCTMCDISAVESELKQSKTIQGLYCEICVKRNDMIEHSFKHAYGKTFY